MSYDNIQQLNEHLGTSGARFSLAVTGAGMTGATAFFTESGASAFIDSISIPYGTNALRRFLHTPAEVQKFPAVTPTVAEELAYYAWCSDYYEVPGLCFGIGVTGKLIVPGERVGREHAVFASACVNGKTGLLTRSMVPTPGTRIQQEEQTGHFIHQLMLDLVARYVQ